ncbi:hypothetical protein NMY22_g15820 [Coprinellus aureogranulatus]|nr:hypothetical protein NMY22_g15820 [Coprinellus aureogranulatus]
MAFSSAPLSKNPQLEPLELNPTTGEPFLRVEGFDDIIITPLRWDDAPTFIPYLNDPAVYNWMAGRLCLTCHVSEGVLGFACSVVRGMRSSLSLLMPTDAENWMNHIIPPQKAVLFELDQARDQPNLITVGAVPVSAIRKVNEDGTDVMIGAIDLSRNQDCGELVRGEDGEYRIDKSVKEESEKINRDREAGDPEIIWDFGDYVAPAYHGRGIMTACIKTILHKWAVPRMNAHIVRGAAFSGNIGSQKTFLKNGFKHIATLVDHIHVRGETKSLEVLEWRKP